MAVFRSIVVAAALAAASWGVGAADAPGTITILEGDAVIYRGMGRFIAAEGVRLTFGDMLETGEKTFAQIEMGDGSALDLGGATRIMLGGGTARGKPERWIYFLNGWGKMSGIRRDPKAEGAYEIRAPLFEVPPTPGVVVFLASPGEVRLFVERGDVRLNERQRGNPLPVALRANDIYQRKANARGTVRQEANPEFLQKMPRPFRDTLPSRMDRYRDKDVRAKEGADFTYADVEHWMKAELAVRRQFLTRYRPRIREAAFRAALVDNLSAHPEWDPILFPEKYLPKDPPSPVQATPQDPARPATGGTVQPPPSR